jgi:tetratricopeptide (TPR) repeat protein
MANTPRDEPAHIVFGVDYTPETGVALAGLSHQEDGAKLIDHLTEKNVQPRPAIRYMPILRDGKQYGIIEVPIQREVGRPFLPARDLAGMKCHDLWLRRDSQNAKANADEIMRVTTWFSGGDSGTPSSSETSGEWERFKQSVRNFESGRYFLLVTDRVDKASGESHSGLGLAPWAAVTDFDPRSEEDGLLFAIRETLEKNRSLQQAVFGQDLPIYPHSGTTWVYARGLAGRETTLQTGPYRTWLKKSGRALGEWVQRMSATLTPAPVTVVVLWNDLALKDHLGKALEEISQSFGDELTLVVVSANSDKLQDLCDKYGAVCIRLTPRALSLGLRDLFSSSAHSSGRCALPTRDEAIPYLVDQRTRLWLEEELEIVHLDIGLDGDGSPEEFAKGAKVSWRDLQLRHDCDRELTDKLRKRVEDELKSRKTVRVNLYHAPGAGGSTVARRVLWELHTSFPAVVLHRTDPKLTAERIGKIYAVAGQTVLVLVDGEEHSQTSINQLYDFVRSQQTPVVMLQVLRSFSPQASPQRDFLLKAELSRVEADRFCHAYGRLAPSRAQALDARAASANGQERTAFYFGLEAFGRDFRGLTRFVEARLGEEGQPLRKVLTFLAIAYRYAQQALPAQCFCELLQLPRDRRVEFRKALAAEALELLVETEVDNWRPSHNLIAEEILRQVLCPLTEDRERLWRQSLSTWALEFAEFTRGDSPVSSDQMLEVARRVFIFRDNAELLGTERSALRQFSQLIEDIPSPEGRLEVLRQLTEVYPEEPHFHAHLGRLCGLMDRFDEALQSLDRALRLSDRDALLHHMRGMILRYQANDLIDKDAALGDVVTTAKKASESFEDSRSLSPENEHAYISEIQLLIRVLDYGAKTTKLTVPQLLALPSTDPFLRESMDRCEELLERVRADREGEKASQYVEDCRARLDVLYGEHANALQAWDGMLARRDVFKPPVRRQIVWTILHRRGRDWSQLKSKEVDRCLQLLNDNFAEGPNEPQSLRLWLRAIRYASNPPSLDSILERVGYWKTNTNSLDAAFYLYVMHTLAALEGSVLARNDAERAIEDCRVLASRRRNRSISFEWLGKGKGVARLIHHSQLGDWTNGFWERQDLLDRIEGRIAAINEPQRGKIELFNGQMAFFVPAVGDFQESKDLNKRVSCFLGFSYDGLRAWEVQPLDR